MAKPWPIDSPCDAFEIEANMQALRSRSHDSTSRCSELEGRFTLDDDAAYRRWRERKLADSPGAPEELLVPIADLAAPTPDEVAAVVDRCRRSNMAIYESGGDGRDPGRVRAALCAFTASFGLDDFETQRSAGGDGLVALQVTDEHAKAGYIPYTNRPISWHTDGYYSYEHPSRCIRAMILHCVRQAADGGSNALLDHEIAYIRLRDADPAFIRALMHEEAMIIPANEGGKGHMRAENGGPVFIVDPTDGALTMRYTARTRNIVWRDDATTREALGLLEHVLESDPLIVRHRLSPGQGVICNNVLHNRTGFDHASERQSRRLLYRARFYGRVRGARVET